MYESASLRHFSNKQSLAATQIIRAATVLLSGYHDVGSEGCKGLFVAAGLYHGVFSETCSLPKPSH